MTIAGKMAFEFKPEKAGKVSLGLATQAGVDGEGECGDEKSPSFAFTCPIEVQDISTMRLTIYLD